jgi:tRNA threonylcarbamoyladenosine biosynthesis protein TsaE
MISKSPKETFKTGAEFARTLKEIARTSPVLVGLRGDLGAGKTVFVQGMASGLGIRPEYYVNSPTFTLINEYKGDTEDLIHVDLYRIDRPLDVESLGLEDYRRPGRVLVVEWIERMPLLEKEANFRVHFRILSSKEREISIQSIS